MSDDSSIDVDSQNMDALGNVTADNMLYIAMNRSPQTPEAPVYQKGTYICGGCKLSFKTLQSLNRHKCDLAKKMSKDEKEVKGPVVQQPDEESVSSDRSTKVLDQEIQQADKLKVTQNSYQCSECGKTYVKQNCFRKHVANHKGKKPWQCFRCGKELKSAVKLKEHCLEHGISRPFKCSKCSSFFATIEVLRVHDRTHTGERPFICKECGKCFKQSSNLQDHLRKHKNERAFICGTCDKSFNLKGDLTKHLLLHSGARPCSCPYCEKSFPGVSNLNRHIATHTGLKPFTCSHCGKSFARKEKLKEHERIHTGERPFTCDVCGKSFSDSGNFSNHKKGHLAPESAKWRLYPKKQRSASLQSSLNTYEDGTSVQGPSNGSLVNSNDFNQRQVTLSLPNNLLCLLGQPNTSAMLYCVAKPVQEILPKSSDQSAENQPLMLQLQNLSENLKPFPDTCDAEGTSLESSDADCSNQEHAGTEMEVSLTIEPMKVDSTVLKTDGDGDIEGTSSFLYESLSPSNLSTGNKAFETPSKILSELRPIYNDSVLKNLKSPYKVISSDSILTPVLQKDLQIISTGQTGKSGAINSAVFALIDTNTENTDHEHPKSGINGDSVTGSEAPVVLEVDSEEQQPSTSFSNYHPHNFLQNFGLSASSELPEHVCAAVLTLNDLTKVEDTQGYSLHPAYVMTTDMDNEARRSVEKLLATPTKMLPEEDGGLITAKAFSQVLVTPDHSESKKHSVIDRSKVKPRALQL